jgi:Na+-translocating ferredoxin:NAD+ oxidoreductase RnfE subunit
MPSMARSNQVFENQLTFFLLGLCPAIAVTARVVDALWMSAGVVLVVVLSALAMAIISGGNGERPPWTRALAVASLLTASLEAGLLVFAPAAGASLGIYAPLIAVNCLVLEQGTPGSQAGAPGSPVLAALGRGVRFAVALVFIAAFRESLGAGTITLFSVGSFNGTIEIHRFVEQPVRAVGFAGGGLLCLGYLAGAVRALSMRGAGRSASAPSAGQSASGQSASVSSSSAGAAR